MPKKSEQFAIENIVQNMQPRQIHEMKLPACFAQKINAIHRKCSCLTEQTNPQQFSPSAILQVVNYIRVQECAILYVYIFKKFN